MEEFTSYLPSTIEEAMSSFCESKPIVELIQPKVHTVYTDGSDNKHTRRCGYGVFFADNDPRNTSIEIKTKKTNNIAELSAIKKGIELVIESDNYKMGDDIIELYTDSQYSINSIMFWADKWENNGWLTEKKKPIKNIELIKELRNLYKSDHRIQLQFVRAHLSEPPKDSYRYHMWYGNMMADKLAAGN